MCRITKQARNHMLYFSGCNLICICPLSRINMYRYVEILPGFNNKNHTNKTYNICLEIRTTLALFQYRWLWEVQTSCQKHYFYLFDIPYSDVKMQHCSYALWYAVRVYASVGLNGLCGCVCLRFDRRHFGLYMECQREKGRKLCIFYAFK